MNTHVTSLRPDVFGSAAIQALLFAGSSVV